jgi:predicted nucleotidyltransferase
MGHIDSGLMANFPERWRGAKGEAELRSAPVIKGAWGYSHSKLGELSKAVARRLPTLEVRSPYCVAIAGSYARMEACEPSDLDFMVVSKRALSREEGSQVAAAIRETADCLGIKPANPEGPFGMSQVATYRQLMAKAGSPADRVQWLSQRMLLLEEARALYNPALFMEALDFIVTRYLEDVIKDPHKDAVFLLNDVIRYFRTICVSYQHKFSTEPDKWCVRNVKLRHSRVVLYVGLLLTILNASVKEDKKAYICDALEYTPLERIARVYAEADDPGFLRLLSVYDVFLQHTDTEEKRSALQFEYDQRFQSAPFRELRMGAMALTGELLRFLWSQRGRWPDSVFEYLLF